MTQTKADPDPGTTSPVAMAVQGPAHPAGGVRRRWPGLTAAGTAFILAAVVMRDHHVAPRALVVYAAYLALGLALPGTLLWRALRGRAGVFAEDVAAGTALAFAVEILTYLPARWIGLPRLFLVWPMATIVAFIAVPSLRRHWRGSGRPAPAWWSWAMSALITVILLWPGLVVFRLHPLRPPGDRTPQVDMLYHLSLIGGLKHHVPPTLPWVLGEPLHYHWFVYAEMAATSWATGIEPMTLLYRLSTLPMWAAFAVLLGGLARRLTGRWWAGPATVVTAFFAVAPSPYPVQASLDVDLPQMTTRTWTSPTQTLGAVLFAATVHVLVDLLRDQRRRPARWAALCVLLAAVMGAKATFLPLLLIAATFVAVVDAVVARRVRRRMLLIVAVTFAVTLFARFVLFGGATQGMAVKFDATLAFLALRVFPLQERTTAVLLVTLLVMVCAWACVWAGIAGLTRRPYPGGAEQCPGGAGPRSGGAGRRPVLEPAGLLVVGLGAAGFAALLCLGHPTLNQFYFSRSASPYLAVASVWGLANAMPARPARRHIVTLACAVTAGLLVAVLVRSGVAAVPPARLGPMADAVVPMALLLGAAGAVAALVVLVSRRCGVRGLGVATAAMVFIALGVPSALKWESYGLRALLAPGHSPSPPPLISKGGRQAGRWLRAHSSPHDLVATNGHCMQPSVRPCDNRRFWTSAFTERRLLVESWGYTDRDNTFSLAAGGGHAGRFWDRRRLADNDAAFRTPSAETIGTLARDYGVRWLFVDGRAPSSPLIGRFATLRFRAGACSVYEITG